MELSTEGADEALIKAVEPIRADPERSAVLCDLDGTLAPIVDRAEDVALPPETKEVLETISDRYALTAIVSGRGAEQARSIVGLDQLAYSGNHGFELILPGESKAHPDPSLDGHELDAPAFVAGLDRRELEHVGIRVEEKGAIVALHWRGAENEGEAESLAHEIAAEADWRDLVTHYGRKVLEIRPNVAINKGIAVAALIPARPVEAVLYGGDDVTDTDAFAALRTLREGGEVGKTVAVAVDSDEAPANLTEDADLIVDGTEGFLEVLRALAG